MRSRLLMLAGFALACYGQQPDAAVQREAMKKLEFLAGTWSGNASLVRGPGESMKLTQTETVQFKLDGLVLLVEGASRDVDGRIVFRALAAISYDDATRTYHFRAYNDGRYLDTNLEVTPKGFAWGYTDGPLKVTNAMRLNDKSEWVETTETSFGSSPARRSLEMTLRRKP